MLRRHSIAFTATTVLAALSVPLNAHAKEDPKGGGSTDCSLFTCQVEANVPGQGGGQAGGSDTTGGNGGSGSSGGDDSNKKVCKYKLADPQPPVGSLDWEGHEPGDGAVYEQTCGWDDFTNTISRMVWLPEPPEQEVIDPAVLAQRAVDKMTLLGPDIGITPKPGGKGVVGMPVYMWTEKGPETYGPNTASASAGGLTVTATAKVKKIVWKMGDGQAVTCTTAGTPYKAAYGKQPSPDCGYRYTEPSSTTSTGKYHVTATSTWVIDWQVTGGGQGGQLTEVRNSAVDITVAEVQVLN
ncbi:ATP/GTP-binding protein [Streptomyces chartreusis]|uniref:ATP/GTP-binding protein n=1 Tax=Streptomyces chartreusis TaxID=1969 RepID=UPI0033A305E7